MNPFLKVVACLVVPLTMSVVAQPSLAHFQLVYTPQVNLEKSGDIPLKLIFWHPFSNGHVMDMDEPEAFVVHHRGKIIDLVPSLKRVVFAGQDNSATAFDAVLPVRRSGDYILLVTPSPYYEASEDIYIQQLTKSFINKSGVPSGWNEPIGAETEIVPLVKPTNVLVGSSFTGRVLSAGKPVAGAEIEVEFMAAEPDMIENRPGDVTASPSPGGAIVVMSDDNGYFTFGIPKEGFWGFAALGVGPQIEHKGKKLSQDAVIWVRSYVVN